MNPIENYLNTQRTIEIIHLRLEIIQEEQEKLIKLSDHLRQKIERIDTHLKQLTGIEYKLYYEIIVRGLKVTKAIDKVSFDVDMSPSTLWKNYYPKIKNKIKEIKLLAKR